MAGEIRKWRLIYIACEQFQFSIYECMFASKIIIIITQNVTNTHEAAGWHRGYEIRGWVRPGCWMGWLWQKEQKVISFSLCKMMIAIVNKMNGLDGSSRWFNGPMGWLSSHQKMEMKSFSCANGWRRNDCISVWKLENHNLKISTPLIGLHMKHNRSQSQLQWG